MFGAKTVLLIGGSTSSLDIAKELVGHAKTIYQSTRGGEFDHPISMLPPGIIRVSEISSFNTEQLSDPTSDNEAIPGTVTLVNGQVITNIDNVIICTGYHVSFPFLRSYHRDSILPSEADDTALVTDGTQTHNLHKDIFYIPDPTLAFIGVPYHIATFSLFDFQSIVVAALFSGKVPLPDPVTARQEYRKKIEEKGSGRSFHSLKGKDKEYVDDLLEWCNPYIVAKGAEPLEGHSKEWQAQYAVLIQKFKELLEPKGGVDQRGVNPFAEAAEAAEAIKVY